ncbi:MAG: CmpX protein [Parcubacteria group bacterium GW2011_GWA2_56_7]|nr:MAG: CmpX protein [Parcubacteria group bacterium GW2011_GWA2_56_7]
MSILTYYVYNLQFLIPNSLSMSYEAIAIVQEAFADLWASILLFLPRLVGAVVVLLVGLFVSWLLKRLIERVSNLLRLDDLAVKLELKRMLEHAGIRLNVAALLGWIVKWFFIVVTLVAAADVLGWNQLTSFLTDVVLYLPNVIIAVVILLVGILLANFVRNLVHTTVEAAKLHSAPFLSGISKWAILLFSFMAALVQLGIAQDLIRILFTGLIAMLAIAGGLAFGLGGREAATRFLNQLRRDISDR